MDPVRLPTSPRPRPSGPRTISRRQTSKSGLPLALSPTSTDETAPRYAGYDSPAPSSAGGSVPSPGTANFDHIPPPPSFRDTREWREQGVQASPTPTPSRPASTASSAPAVKAIAKPPTLTPPPALNFESVPVAWRGMTLESAQWTLTSAELQEIVSRAIRRTAQESFIRLLPVKTLDEDLGVELERLETAKATAQSKYRFNMHRRTMLLQSLVALTSGETDCAALASLTTQLAEVSASCDTLMMELLRTCDQRAQIQRVQEVHISSALAMALRKLNASYGKRTDELKAARQDAEHLKAELEEAWKVAQDMAQEMDDLENFHSGFSSESDLGEDDSRIEESVRLAEVIGVTGKAVATKATLTQLAAKERERNDYENHSQRVTAARKRSSRMSKTGLRLPKSTKGSSPSTPTAERRASISSRTSRGSRSKGARRRSTEESASPGSQPPIPALRVDTASLKKSPKDDSFLEMAETRPASPASPLPPSAPPPPLPGSASLSTGHSPSAPQSDAPPPHDRRDTLDFIIPPITISPAEGDAEHDLRNARRVQSLQPPPPPPMRAHSSDPDDGLRHPSGDFRHFDGWQFAEPAPKSVRRRSMPLTAAGAGAPPPRVFEPPPEYSAHAPAGSSRPHTAHVFQSNQ